MGEAVFHGGAVRTIGGQIVVWLFEFLAFALT